MSRSKSESKIQTSSQQSDERIAATDDAIVIQLEGGSSIEFTDPGILEAAEGAFIHFDNIFTESLGFVAEERDESFALIRGTIDKAFADKQSDDRAGFESLLKWGALLGLGYVAVKGLK